jgi:hypothetical protein
VPSDIALKGLAASTASELTLYDGAGIIVLGPAGWRCRTGVGEDGNTTFAIYPPTEHPTGFSVHPIPEAVMAYFASPGTGSVWQTACPYFPVPSSQLGVPCISAPPGQRVVVLSTLTVEFTAGPDSEVLFAGYPAPRTRYLTRGVVMYAPLKAPASANELTCAVGGNSRALCDAILRDFETRNVP